MCKTGSILTAINAVLEFFTKMATCNIARQYRIYDPIILRACFPLPPSIICTYLRSTPIQSFKPEMSFNIHQPDHSRYNGLSFVLIFQFSTSFGTEASVPVVQGTGSGTSVLIPTSRYQSFSTRFSGGYLHFSHFGTCCIPYRDYFGSTLGGTQSFGNGT